MISRRNKDENCHVSDISDSCYIIHFGICRICKVQYTLYGSCQRIEL